MKIFILLISISISIFWSKPCYSGQAEEIVGTWELKKVGNEEVWECPDVITFSSGSTYRIFNDCYGAIPPNPIIESGNWYIVKNGTGLLLTKRDIKNQNISFGDVTGDLSFRLSEITGHLTTLEMCLEQPDSACASYFYEKMYSDIQRSSDAEYNDSVVYNILKKDLTLYNIRDNSNYDLRRNIPFENNTVSIDIYGDDDSETFIFFVANGTKFLFSAEINTDHLSFYNNQIRVGMSKSSFKSIAGNSGLEDEFVFQNRDGSNAFIFIFENEYLKKITYKGLIGYVTFQK